MTEIGRKESNGSTHIWIPFRPTKKGGWEAWETCVECACLRSKPGPPLRPDLTWATEDCDLEQINRILNE